MRMDSTEQAFPSDEDYIPGKEGILEVRVERKGEAGTYEISPSGTGRSTILSGNPNSDVIEWEIDVPFTRGILLDGDVWIGKECAVTWKSAKWTLLLKRKPDSRNDLGCFVGIDDTDELPQNFRVNVNINFQLLDPDGNPISKGGSQSQTHHHLFTKPDRPGDRVDYGSFESFEVRPILAMFERRCNEQQQMFGTTPTHVYIKLRVKLEQRFSCAIRPFNYDSKKVTGMVGLRNLGATCYLNALLQMLYHVSAFRRAVYNMPLEEASLRASTTLALQNIFHELQFSPREVSTQDLTTAFGWTSADSFTQQDVQEMMRVLLDKLEEKMKGTSLDGTIKYLFAGTVRSFVRCIDVDYESKREEDFYDIQLDVKGYKDVYESFRQYVAMETLDGDNRYDAGPVHGKQDARKGVIFTKFPPVLTIHLKRFAFDPVHMDFTKIHDNFQFPARLCLDEFLAADAPAESRLHANTYLLHSVLVHSGDVGAGHYYAYIRPGSKFDYGAAAVEAASCDGADTSAASSDGEWFSFNDETVLAVTSKEAIEFSYGRGGSGINGTLSSAYMLVYIREAEAAVVMKDVVNDEIPTQLLTRLRAETSQLEMERREAMQNKMNWELIYFSDDDIRTFAAYRTTNALIDETSMRTLKINRGSTVLGWFLLLADATGIRPTRLRLWLAQLQKNDIIAVKRPILLDDFTALIKHEMRYTYAQRLELSENDDERERSLNEQFDTLRQKEEAWRERLFALLTGETAPMGDSHNALEDSKSRHVCRSIVNGCGIGLGVRWISEFLPAGTARDILLEIQSLNDEMIRLIASFPIYTDLNANRRLYFIKAYDHDNELALDDADVVDTPSPDPDSYRENPVRYLGCIEIDYEDQCENFEQIRRLTQVRLIERLGTGNRNLTSWADTPQGLNYYMLPHCFLEQCFNITQFMFPAICAEAVREFMQKNWHVQSCVLVVAPSHAKPSFVDWADWTVNNRTITFIPFGPIEEDIIALALKDNADEFSTSSPESGKKRKQTMPVTQLTPQVDAGVDSRLELLSSPDEHNAVIRSDDGAQGSKPSNLRHPLAFERDVRINHDLGDALAAVEHVSGVDRRQIILYRASASNSEDRSQMLPIAARSSSILKEILREISDDDVPLEEASLVFFFRFAPFPRGPFHEGTRNAHLEINLVGSDLISWRNRFLLHLRSTNQMPERSVAGGWILNARNDSSLKKPRKADEIMQSHSSLGFLGSETEGVVEEAKAGSTNELNPQWPQYESKPLDAYFNLASPLRVYVESRKVSPDWETIQVADLMSDLRNAIGLPLNIDDLTGLKGPDFEVFEDENFTLRSSDTASVAANSNSNDIVDITEDDERSDSQLKRLFNVISEGLAFCGDEEEDEMRSDDSLSRAGFAFSSGFPLALYQVQSGRVVRIFKAFDEVEALKYCWCDETCDKAVANSCRFGVQRISPEAYRFMLAESRGPGPRSFLLAICPFRFKRDGAAQCLAPMDHVTERDDSSVFFPFITYLLETDTYGTLMDRICDIIGSKWRAHKLFALPLRRHPWVDRPVLLPGASSIEASAGSPAMIAAKPTLPNPALSSHRDPTSSAHKATGADSIWHIVTNLNPTFCSCSLNEVSRDCKGRPAYPHIGVEISADLGAIRCGSAASNSSRRSSVQISIK